MKKEPQNTETPRVAAPSNEGVEIFTWGSEIGETSGATKTPSQVLYGENVGHASIMLHLKNTEENRAMVKRYCDDANIPYTTIKNTVPSIKYTESPYDGPEVKPEDLATLDQHSEYQAYKQQLIKKGQQIALNAEGERVILSREIDTNAPAYEEELIQVYFSWWPPANESDRFSLNTLEQDHQSERLGVEAHYTDAARNYLNPERRIQSGALGSMTAHEINLEPKTSLHTETLPYEVIDAFEMRRLVDEEYDRYFLIDRILGKIDFTKEDVKVSDSMMLMMEAALGEQLVAFREESGGNRVTNLAALEELLQKLKKEAAIHFGDYSKGYLGDLDRMNEKNNNSTPIKYNGYAAVYLKMLANRERDMSVDSDIKKSTNEFLDHIGSELPLSAEQIIEALGGNKKLKTFFEHGHKLIQEKGKPVIKFQHGHVLRAINTGIKEFHSNKMLSIRLTHYQKIRAEFEAPVMSTYVNQALVANKPPDNSVMLPLKSEHYEGINPEALLKAMHDFVSDPDITFDLATNNCSVATSSVLAECSGESGAKIFGKKELASTMSPQMVVTHAGAYLETILNPEHSIQLIEDSSYVKARNYVVGAALDGFSKTFGPNNTLYLRSTGFVKTLVCLPGIATILMKESIISSNSGYTQNQPEQTAPSSTQNILSKLGGAKKEKNLSATDSQEKPKLTSSKSQPQKQTGRLPQPQKDQDKHERANDYKQDEQENQKKGGLSM